MRRHSVPSLITVGRWMVPQTGHPPGTARLREGWWEPATDILAADDAVIIKMELAGVRADAIEVTVDGRILRVRGQRPNECPGENCEFRQVEISYGEFERAFEFPYPLGDAEISPSYADGFLTIRVVPAQVNPRRIPIDPAP